MWFIVLTLLGCTVGNGESATETRSVTGFRALELTTFLDAEVTVAPEESVSVTCDSNLLEHIRTRLDGDALEISTPNGMNLAPKTDCYVEIAGPHFRFFATSGSGNLTGKGPFPDLQVARSSGSGSQSLGGIDSEDLVLRTSGSGNLRVDGVASVVDIHTSGSGAVNARDLEAQDADVEITGSGGVSATVFGALKARLSGSGNLDCYGDPVSIDKRTTGSGRVIVH